MAPLPAAAVAPHAPCTANPGSDTMRCAPPRLPCVTCRVAWRAAICYDARHDSLWADPWQAGMGEWPNMQARRAIAGPCGSSKGAVAAAVNAAPTLLIPTMAFPSMPVPNPSFTLGPFCIRPLPCVLRGSSTFHAASCVCSSSKPYGATHHRTLAEMLERTSRLHRSRRGGLAAAPAKLACPRWCRG